MTRIKIKALLFSALVFPGTGQYILKRFKTATFFIIASLVLVVLMGIEIFKKASVIADKIINEGIQPEFSTIKSLLTNQQDASQFITILIYLLLAIWFISFVDVLRTKEVNHNN